MKKQSVHSFFIPRVLKEIKTDSSFSGENSEDFLLESIWPVFKLAQVIGLAPLTFEQGTSSYKNNSIASETVSKSDGIDLSLKSNPKTFLTSKWYSFPSLINGILTIHLLWMTIWVMMNIKGLLSTWFNGTDLYTFTIQVYLYFGQSSLILMNAFWKRKKLSKLWYLLHHVYQDLTCIQINTGTLEQGLNQFQNSTLVKYLKRLRRLSQITTLTLILLAIIYGAYFVLFSIRLCFIKDDNNHLHLEEIMTQATDSYKSTCVLDDWVLFIEKITYASIGIYHLTISTMFAACCFIVWIMQQEIGKQLKLILVNRRMQSQGLDENEIQKLRMSHGNLSKCCRTIGDFFGLPILGTCVASIVSLTCAVYMFILGATDLNTEGKVSEHTNFFQQYAIVWIFHGSFGAASLALILISGQMVQNAAEIPIQILVSASHEGLTDAEKYEISILIQKQGAFQGITACNISTIGLSFLASAATNVTTYLLVLLQFRLGVDKDKTQG